MEKSLLSKVLSTSCTNEALLKLTFTCSIELIDSIHCEMNNVKRDLRDLGDTLFYNSVDSAGDHRATMCALQDLIESVEGVMETLPASGPRLLPEEISEEVVRSVFGDSTYFEAQMVLGEMD